MHSVSRGNTGAFGILELQVPFKTTETLAQNGNPHKEICIFKKLSRKIRYIIKY